MIVLLQMFISSPLIENLETIQPRCFSITQDASWTDCSLLIKTWLLLIKNKVAD